MSPFALVEHTLLNALNFKGRAGRAEYWYWILFTIGFGIGLYFIGLRVPMLDWIAKIWVVLAFLIGISLTVRRLHDLDLSGKWALLIPSAGVATTALASVAPELAAHLLFVPVVLVMLLAFFIGFIAGEQGANRFGPRFPPKPAEQR